MSRRGEVGGRVVGGGEVGTVHLLRRQVLTDRPAVLTVALVVAVTAALAAAVPRALDTLQTHGARAAVAQAGPLERDLAAVAFAGPPLQAGDDPLAPTRDLLAATVVDLPPLIAQQVGEPGYAADFRELAVTQVLPALDAPADNAFLELSVQSGVEDHVRFVAGGPPRRITVEPRPDALAADPGRVLPRSVTHRADLEVAVSSRTAADLGLAVGSTARLAEVDLTLHVVGLFEPVDDADRYWGFDTRVLRPQQNYSSSLGVYYTGVALLAERAYPELEHLLAGVRTPVTLLRLPVGAAGLRGDDVPHLLDAVRRVEGTTVPVEARGGPVRQLTSFRLATDLDRLLVAHLGQRVGSTAVVSLVVSGLLGVAVAVLALASRLVVERRARSLALAVARGASPAQLRTLMVLEGLVLGVPAAAAGWAAAAVLVPGDGGPWGVVLPMVLGLAPAVLLPVLARPGGLRPVRRDVAHRRARWARLAAEVLVVLAAAAVLVLVRADGGAAAPETAVDPLLAAAPVLLALAGAVVLSRLYPLPLARLVGALSRRRGAVAFLGAARSSRDAPTGTAPLVVLLLALSTAVFGAVVTSTTQRGADLAATATVGADARMSSLGFDEAELAAARQVEGVEAVAGIVDLPVELATERRREEVTLVAAADAEALTRVQRELPAASRYPEELWQAGPRLPVVAGPGVGRVGDEVVLGDGSAAVDAVVVAVAAADVPGVRTSRPWVLADRGLLLAAGGEAPLPSTVLLDLADPVTVTGDRADRLEAELRAATGTASPLLTRDGAVGRVREAPLVAGTLAAFPAATAVAAALSALAVVLTLVVTAPARGRVLSRLRTLGLSSRQAQGLAVWEVAPLALTALVTGLLLGLVVPWLVAPSVDLRPFTGGTTPPPYTLDLLALAVVAVGFVGLVVAAVAVTVALNGRPQLGAVLRVGEEQ